MPSLHSIYANRTIYNGYKTAFIEKGHEFITLTADDSLEEILSKEKPDIFITASHFYYQKFIDNKMLLKFRQKGLKVFVKIDFWKSPLDKSRINEARSMSDEVDKVEMIRNGTLGDYFFHVVEQDDERMRGFELATGKKFYTIPLAADKTLMKYSFEPEFKADISYIGTYLPAKRKFFKEYVFPLKNIYDLKLYGQDWTYKDRVLGWVARIGQYFNLPVIRSLQKPKLKLDDEAKIYSSSLICVNVHEDYQKEFGGDCNERTFKIPLCGGFEITDDVACIRKYFKDGEEMIIAKNKEDWFEKINFYMKNPEKRDAIIKAGQRRVLLEHTYHNRVDTFIDIYNNIK